MELLTSRHPKAKQVEAVQNVILQRDTLCLLPTGYGKTLIFQVLPPLYSLLSQEGLIYHSPNDPLVIVVSPLVALMKSQVESINKGNRIDGALASTLDDFAFRERKEINILIGSPESWLHQSTMHKIIKHLSKDIIAIVVDEAHTVKW